MKAIQIFFVMVFALTMQVETHAQSADLNEHGFIKKGIDSSNYVVYLYLNTVESEFFDQENNLISQVTHVYDSVGYFKHVDRKLFKLSKDYFLKAFVNDGTANRVPVDYVKKDLQIENLLIRYSSNNNELCVVSKDSFTLSETKIAYQILTLLTLFFALLFSTYRKLGLTIIILLSLGIIMLISGSHSEIMELIYYVFSLLIVIICYGFINLFENKKWILILSLLFHVAVTVILVIEVLPIFTPTSFAIFLLWFVLTTILRHKLLLYHFKKNKENDQLIRF